MRTQDTQRPGDGYRQTAQAVPDRCLAVGACGTEHAEKRLGDLGDVASPFWASHPQHRGPGVGQLRQRLGRDLGDLTALPLRGETVVQRQEVAHQITQPFLVAQRVLEPGPQARLSCVKVARIPALMSCDSLSMTWQEELGEGLRGSGPLVLRERALPRPGSKRESLQRWGVSPALWAEGLHCWDPPGTLAQRRLPGFGWRSLSPPWAGWTERCSGGIVPTSPQPLS